MSMTRNPTLEEVISAAISSRLGALHTSMPGRVESYDASTQKATVKPLIQNVEIPLQGEEIVDILPILHDVPVIFPRSGGFFISFAIQPGDLVLLVFAERSIDVWVHGQGDDVNPVDTRRHDLSDAVCIPGLYPFQKSLKNSSTNGVKLGSDDNGGMRAEITSSELKVTLGSGETVTFSQSDAGASMKLGSGLVSAAIAENLQTLWELGLLPYLTLMAASITALGGNPPAPPPPWTPNIVSTKVKVPS